MKKIGLYLSVGPRSGGSFQYCLSVIKYLHSFDSKNYKIKAFIFDDLWKNKLNKNIDLIKLDKISILGKFLNFISFFFPDIINKILYNFFHPNIKILNNSGCDVIIFPSQEGLSSKIKINSITMVHDLMHRYEAKFEEYKIISRIKRDYLYKAICKNSSKIIVDSKIGKKHVFDSYNVEKDKIIIAPFEVPHYLEKSKIRNIFKKYKIPKKKFIFYPAQFWEHKNHINLIKAFNLLQNKINDINLVLVGGEKNNLKKVINEILNLKLSDKVFILGYIDEKDMYSFYKKASLMSFVSFCGPTNIPPLESMYLGCPLIYSNVYAMKNQVKNGGLFINPYSYKDIYRKMFTILTNKNLRQKNIKNGINIIRKNKKNSFLKSLDTYLK